MPEWTVDVTEKLSDELKAAMLLADVEDQRRNVPPDALILTIDRIGPLKVQVFSNEHPPPHFRVITNKESNNFTISDCSPLNGNALSRFFRQIREWHRTHKQELMEAWNDRRPSDCPVGEYRA